MKTLHIIQNYIKSSLAKLLGFIISCENYFLNKLRNKLKLKLVLKPVLCLILGLVLTICNFLLIPCNNYNKIYALTGENYIDEDDQFIPLYIGPSFASHQYGNNITYNCNFYPVSDFIGDSPSNYLSTSQEIAQPVLYTMTSWFTADGEYTNRSNIILQMYQSGILSRITLTDCYALTPLGTGVQLYCYGYHIHNYDKVIEYINNRLIFIDTSLNNIEASLTPSNTTNLYEQVNDIYNQLNSIRTILNSGLTINNTIDNATLNITESITWNNQAISTYGVGTGWGLNDLSSYNGQYNGRAYFYIRLGTVTHYDYLYNLTLPFVLKQDDLSKVNIFVSDYLDGTRIYNPGDYVQLGLNNSQSYILFNKSNNYYIIGYIDNPFIYNNKQPNIKFINNEDLHYYQLIDYYFGTKPKLENINNLLTQIYNNLNNLTVSDVTTHNKLDDILDEIQLIYGYLQNQTQDESSLAKPDDVGDLVDRNDLLNDLYDDHGYIVDFQEETNLSNDIKNQVSALATSTNGIFDAFFDNGFGIVLALPVVLAFVGLIL